MASKTMRLIRAIEGLEKPLAGEIRELAVLAGSNKVLLGFLRSTGVEDGTRLVEEGKYKRYRGVVAGVADALKGLDYALYKFRKPVEHVSVDVDVLINLKHLPKAVKKLVSRGFRVEVLEKYTVTLTRGRAIVDLYTHPAFAWVVYLDGGRLLECCVEEFEWEGLNLRGLTRDAEVVVAAAHAVYKEHIYLVLDYLTVKKWMSKRVLELASKLNVEDSLEIITSLNELVDRGLIELPFKIPVSYLAKAYLNKIVRDSDFRSTLTNILEYLLTKRAGVSVKWRLTRVSY
ncbi:MAG: nucleotidyltransferase family protein [Thermoprotei archaeon]